MSNDLGLRLRRILARARYGVSERLVEEWTSALEELLRLVEGLPTPEAPPPVTTAGGDDPG